MLAISQSAQISLQLRRRLPSSSTHCGSTYTLLPAEIPPSFVSTFYYIFGSSMFPFTCHVYYHLKLFYFIRSVIYYLTCL